VGHGPPDPPCAFAPTVVYSLHFHISHDISVQDCCFVCPCIVPSYATRWELSKLSQPRPWGVCACTPRWGDAIGLSKEFVLLHFIVSLVVDFPHSWRWWRVVGVAATRVWGGDLVGDGLGEISRSRRGVQVVVRFFYAFPCWNYISKKNRKFILVI
jgi:hypothetical protein